MIKAYKLMIISFITLTLCIGCSTKDLVVSDEPINLLNEKTVLSHQSNTSLENKIRLAMNTPKTLNPLYNTSQNIQHILYLLFSPLINVEENGTISGNLAHSWMFNEDNTALTLTLNTGISWHDGKPLTTEDVIFTLEQIQKIPDSPYKQAIRNIASLEKIDDMTMKILYRQAFSGTLQTLFIPIIPKHVYAVEQNDSLNIIPVGSGPYIFKSLTTLKNMKLEANDAYFKGAPHIKEIEVNIIPDEESSLHSFKQNLIDVIYTDITEWGKYASDKSSKSYEMHSNIYEFIGLNLNKAMFQNTKIRQALLLGLDREKLVHLYYLDHAFVTDSPISPFSYLTDKTLKIQEYDKEKVKLLLTQEGYERQDKTGGLSKNSIPFSFNLLVNEENTDRVKVANEIRNMYEDIGIEVHIEVVDQETYLSRIASRQYDAFLGGFKLSYALDLSFALHSNSISSGGNYISYKDSQMDELLQQVFVATDKNILEAYGALQHYFSEQNPYISLFFKKSVLITKDKISGEIKPTPLNIFANIEKWVLK